MYTLLESIKMSDLEISLNASYDKKWESNYFALKRFIAINKRLPNKYENKDLRGWITNQKSKYNNNTLSHKYIILLSIIPEWIWDGVWDQCYNKLCQFIKKNKRLPKNNETCSKWVLKQRLNYHKNKLPQSRINKLEKINMWKWRHEKYNWNSRYEAIKLFVKKHGRIPNYLENNLLRRWLNIQRSKYNTNLLPKTKIDKLDNLLGVEWKERIYNKFEENIYS